MNNEKLVMGKEGGLRKLSTLLRDNIMELERKSLTGEKLYENKRLKVIFHTDRHNRSSETVKIAEYLKL